MLNRRVSDQFPRMQERDHVVEDQIGRNSGVAAARLILSAILYLLSPVQRTYDSATSYLYLGVTLAGYIAVIVVVLGFTRCTADRHGTAYWGLPERC